MLTSSFSLGQKFNFTIKKYFYLVKHSFSKNNKSHYEVNLLGENFFYEDSHSLFFYQSLFVTNENFLKNIKKEEILTIVDVGANVGLFSKTIRHFFPSAKIYAVEPIPSAKACLDKNFKHDNLFQSDQVAFSDKNGKIKMTSVKTDTQHSHVSDAGNLLVSATTLDAYVRKYNITYIDLLKIDTETFEAHVLKGGSKALKNTKYLFLEVNFVNNSNYTFSSLMSLLFSKDYDFQLVKIKSYSQKVNEAVLFDCLFINTSFDRLSKNKASSKII